MWDGNNLDEKLKIAREVFLEASDNYQKDGRPLEQRCISYFERYVDAEEGRSPAIKNAAHDTLNSLRAFSNTKARLATNIALVSIAIEQSALAIQMDILNDAMNSVGATRVLDAAPYQIRSEIAAALAIECMEVATPVYALRTNAMAAFLGETVDVSIGDMIAGLAKATLETGKEKAVEKLLELAAPRLSLLLEAIKFLNTAKNELRTIKHPYRGRGAEDDLFDFFDILSAQNAAFANINLSIDNNVQALTRPI